MILLWLGLTALIESIVSLIPADAFVGAAWLQLLIVGAFAAGLTQLTRKQRSISAFGIRGQWLILIAALTLLLTQGGLPGDAERISDIIGIDTFTRQRLTQLSLAILIVGLWQALSNLARSKEQAVRALEAALHNAMTEMVIETVPRVPPPRAPIGARHTQTGLTPPLTAALAEIGPAHRALRDLVLREPNNIAARLALHNRLRQDETQVGALRLHAEDFIDALWKAGRVDLALGIAEECARHDTAYYPPVDQVLDLAQRAILVDKHAIALRLLKHFDVRHPAHPSIPRAFLISAQALGGMGHTQAAQALLGALIGNFPEDAVAADAIALSARLAARR